MDHQNINRERSELDDFGNAKTSKRRKLLKFFPQSSKAVPAYLLILLAALMPIIFLPVTVASFQATKVFFFVTLTLLALGFWIFTRLRNDTFRLPFNLLTLSIIIVPLVYLITSLFSEKIRISLVGGGFEINSTMIIATLFLLLAIIAAVFQDLKNTFKIYGAILVSFIAVAVFHIVRIVFIDIFPNFNYFGAMTSNTVGKWNDVAIFAGLIVVMLMTTLESIKAEKKVRIVQIISMVLAIILLVVVNFTLAWYLVGFFALLFFVYFLSVNRSEGTDGRGLPATSLVVLLVSFFFILSSTTVGPFISGILKIDYTEVRPSWLGTFNVVKNTLAEDPITGIGPTRFSSAWQDHKPMNINQTDYYNVDFNFGVGYLPSAIAETGVLGLLAWGFFLAMIIITGFKAMFRQSADSQVSKFILASSFIATLYLWVSMIAYVPSVSTLVLTFIFTGIFVGSLQREGLLNTKVLDLKHDAKFSFLYISVLVLILMGTVAYEYDSIKRFVSNYYFQQANLSLNVAGDIDATERNLRQAIGFHENDVYYRSLSSLYRVRINQIIQADSGDQTTLIGQFRDALSLAVETGKRSIAFDDTNYLNYIALGDVYQTIVPLGVDGSYDQAKEFYQKALDVNEKNPAIHLALARLEVANQNADEARQQIKNALDKKSDFLEAIFLLSQIDVSEGKTDDAIRNVEAAAVLKPNDPAVFFQLGLLRYSAEKFEEAVGAFERAVRLNPVYSNAKYFLGLSYDRVGRDAEAIQQFEDLLVLNPDNVEVQFILDNLREGNAPFRGAEPPIDNTPPESRETLPVEDESPETIEEE